MITFLSLHIKAQVLDPNDPIVVYDSENPPVIPPRGQIGKWVITPEVNWNSDNWKSYVYNGLAFRLRYPKNYDPNRSEEYPMIVLLHGYGFRNGTLFMNDRHLNNAGARAFDDAVNNGDFDGFLMSPQAIDKFSGPIFQAIEEIVDIIDQEHNLDLNRVSLNGRSGGAVSTWDFIADHPRLFSSALPISGVSPGTADRIPQYKYVPIWSFQGERDKGPYPYQTEALINQIVAQGGNVRYTLYLGKGHGIMDIAYREDDFFPYMTRSNKTNPMVLYEQSEFCPGDPINITLGVSPGFEAYEWRKDGQLITGATSHELNVTEIGIYAARFRRNGVWTYWSPDPVNVKIKEPTVTPPIALESPQTTVLPDINGNSLVALSVPEGYESYTWKKVGNDAIIGTERVLNVTESGDYIVTVTERFGCSSNFSDPFTVYTAAGTGLPDPINGLTAYAPSKTEVQLNWSDNPNAPNNETGFEIYRSTVSGGVYEFITLTSADQLSYLDQNLLPATEYFYVIRPVNTNGAGTTSDEVSVRTQVDSEAPTAPSNLTVTGYNENSVTLSWEASTDNVGVYRYDIYQNGVKAIVVEGTSATVFNLTRHEVYNFTVKARDLTGNESPSSSQVTAVPRSSGINYKYYEGTWSVLPDFNALTPKKEGNSPNIDINLRDRGSNFAFYWEGFIDIPVAGTYTFETRSDDGSKLYIGEYDEANLVVDNDGTHGSQSRYGDYTFAIPGTYPIVITYFQASSGRRMEVYWSSNQGLNRQRIPNASFVDDFVMPGTAPNTPTKVDANATSFEQIDVSWEDNSDNETGFQIYRAKSVAGPYSVVATVAPNNTTYSDIGLEAATTYYYKIVAIGQYGESDAEAPSVSRANWLFNNDYTDSSGNNLPATPRNNPVFSEDRVEGSHSISFAGNSGYVQLGSGSGEFHNAFTERSISMWIKPLSSIGNQVIYDEGGSTNGMGIRILDGNIEVGVQDNHRIVIVGSPLTQVGEWIHIGATFDNGGLYLYVNGQEVASNPSVGYTVVNNHSNGAGLGATNSSNGFDNNGSPFDGLIDDFSVYRVALSQSNFQAKYEGTESNPIATTFNLPPAPVSPTGLVATAISPYTVELNWTDNSNDEDVFEIYRSTNNNQNFLLLDEVTPNVTTYVDEGLFSNVTYFYQIQAKNEGGSTPSNEASVSTLNNIPQLTGASNVNMRFDTEYYINLSATDEDLSALTFSVQNLPIFGELTDYGDGSALILLSPASTDLGTFENVIVTVADPNGGQASSTITIDVSDNFIPVLQPIGNLSLEENSTLEVNLSASDQNAEDVLSWEVIGLPSFATFTENIGGSATLNIAPTLTDAGIYPITVKVIDDNGAEVIEQLNINVADKALGMTIYVNFNGTGFDANAPWNNTHTDAFNGQDFTNLLDEDGNATNVGFITSDFGFNTLGSTSSMGIYPANVMRTSYWSSRANETVTIYGLDNTLAYDLTFFGSRDEGTITNRGTDYMVNGQTVTLNASQNSTETVSLTNLAPNANGELLITVARAAGSSFSYLNALVINGNFDDGTIPASPTSLQTTLVSGESIELSWNDIAYNEDGYEVYRATDITGPYTLLNSGGTQKNASSYIDATVIGNTAYYYKVRAFNTNGFSDYSDVVSAITLNATPTLVAVGTISLNAYESVNVNISATDADPGDAVTLNISNLPSFASFTDNGNGNGSLVITPTLSDIGSYGNIEISATDLQGSTASETITINVANSELTTVYINFNGNNPAAQPWNNTIGTPNANNSIGDLADEVGISTGISLKLLDAWSGFNDVAGVSGNGSGLYPDEVMTSYYWDGSTNIKRLQMSGLNPGKKYNFSFFASRDGGGDRTTNYSIGTNTVSLNASSNASNTVQINGVSPDANGELIIEVQKASTASYGYLNAIVVQAYTDTGLPFVPSGLQANTTSRTDIELNWSDNSDNETGFEIWRQDVEGDVFNLISTVGAGVTSYADASLNANSTYAYKVRAINNAGVSDFSATSSATTLTFAVYVNFNETGGQGTPWNNTSSIPQLNSRFDNLLNDEGNSTGINMEITSNFNGVNPFGTLTGDDSGVFPDEVMRESYWLDFGETGQLNISGLSSFYEYNFVFFGSRAGSGDRTSVYTIGNQSASLNASYNTSETAQINGVLPDANGEIVINIDLGSAASFAYINAMVIQAVEKDLSNQRKAFSSLATDLSSKGEPKLEVVLSPNPFTNVINFNLSGTTRDKNLSLKMLSVNGQEIFKEEIEVSNDMTTFTLDTKNKNIQSGLYFVVLTGNTFGRNIFKIIKK